MRTIPMESRCSEKITLTLQFGLVHVSKRGLGKQIYVLVFTNTVHSLQSQNDREALSVLYRVVQKNRTTSKSSRNDIDANVQDKMKRISPKCS